MVRVLGVEGMTDRLHPDSLNRPLDPRTGILSEIIDKFRHRRFR